MRKYVEQFYVKQHEIKALVQRLAIPVYRYSYCLSKYLVVIVNSNNDKFSACRALYCDDKLKAVLLCDLPLSAASEDFLTEGIPSAFQRV